MYNAIHLYRLARWLYLHHIPLIPMMIQLIIFCGYGCRLSYKTKIGKGTFLSHGGLGVTVSPKSEIGEGCVLGFRCSIVGQPPYIRTPKIGNHVYISPGAVIQGPLIIGDNVIIAANSVVTKSVPDYAIVGGIPAKIIGDSRDLDYDIFETKGWLDGTKEFMTKK
ncbi:MAG TPA: serine acetyltransferase [Porphyromonadaceae bacterium]|nr:serine acetyltransferase [Porphyromonadaceae bacterium]